ncbi:UDP-glucose dehydrogenase family protein [Brachybacterium sp. DNPG3]
MRISVIGVGYLGAVHAASMAEIGHDVVGLDVDAARIAALAAGRAPFHEPGFEELLGRGLDAGRLRFTTSVDEIADADVHFLALGTPQREDGFGADLRQVRSAIDALAAALLARRAAGGDRADAPVLVVGKSTVPVGTARELAARLEQVPGVRLLWNPEFLREGRAVEDTLHPDRLVYGLPDESLAGAASDAEPDAESGSGAASASDPASDAAVRMLDAVYAPILAEGAPRLIMGWEAAELVKVSANAFLATKISFINAVSEVCEAAGADIADVSRAIGLDPRIGRDFLRAGVGFGGGCLPKDVRAFMARAEDLGVGRSLAMLREVDSVNERRRVRVVELAREMLGDLAGRRIALLGAAFKPDSDDVRDSPALAVAARLMSAGADVVVADPVAAQAARRAVANLQAGEDVSEALAGAELTILLTEWREYRDLDPAEAATLVAAPRMIDGRGVLDPVRWARAGWELRALGRGIRPSGAAAETVAAEVADAPAAARRDQSLEHSAMSSLQN